jgi:hypothetical protein
MTDPATGYHDIADVDPELGHACHARPMREQPVPVICVPSG